MSQGYVTGAARYDIPVISTEEAEASIIAIERDILQLEPPGMLRRMRAKAIILTVLNSLPERHRDIILGAKNGTDV